MERPREHPKQGCLTRAVTSNQRDAIPFLDIKTYIIKQRGELALGNRRGRTNQRAQPGATLSLRLHGVGDLGGQVSCPNMDAHLQALRSTAVQTAHIDGKAGTRESTPPPS